MQKQIVGFCISVVLSTSAWGGSKNSQVRFPGETVNEARERIQKQFQIILTTSLSPVDIAVAFDQQDWSQVRPWSATTPMESIFEAVRDVRFLFTLSMPTFSRRISWLYPDDGCFARAAMTNQKIEEWGIERMSELFVFGELRVKTGNSYNGMVEWWYHEVPVTQRDGMVSVFDAAVYSGRPLPVQDWIGLMGQDIKSITAAICDPYTYSPWDPCIEPPHDVESEARVDQGNYLSTEWRQLEALGRHPDQELGDDPPWKKI